MKGVMMQITPIYQGIKFNNTTIMKNSDFNTLGLEAINELELEKIDGGFFGGLVAGLVLATALEYFDDPAGFEASFKRGFNSF